jgi:hypothetical protein
MKISDLLNEDGRIVKGVNTTVDVSVNQTKIEAKKFGNTVTVDGFPPVLRSNGKQAVIERSIMEQACIDGGHDINDLYSTKLFDWNKY